MCIVGDLVSVGINRGNPDTFQGIIIKTWTAFRKPCRTPYTSAIVRCFDGTEIEVPTWYITPLDASNHRDNKKS